MSDTVHECKAVTAGTLSVRGEKRVCLLEPMF